MPLVSTDNLDHHIKVTWPKRPVVDLMSCGGWWDEHPNPRGYVEIQIERLIKDGCLPDAARRFCHAVQFGGRTTSEALEIIRDRVLGHVAHDIVWADREELPDHRFRNAWTRNRSGNSAIAIEMKKARRIQLDRIKTAIKAANHRRLLLCRRLVTADWLTLGRALRHARDADELARIWPEGIRA